MYYQLTLLRPILGPDIAEPLIDFWYLEMINASALLTGLVPITLFLAIYLRVVPPSLDDYAHEVAEEEGKA